MKYALPDTIDTTARRSADCFVTRCQALSCAAFGPFSTVSGFDLTGLSLVALISDPNDYHETRLLTLNGTFAQTNTSWTGGEEDHRAGCL